jgi:hypothetical protein
MIFIVIRGFTYRSVRVQTFRGPGPQPHRRPGGVWIFVVKVHRETDGIVIDVVAGPAHLYTKRPLQPSRVSASDQNRSSRNMSESTTGWLAIAGTAVLYASLLGWMIRSGRRWSRKANVKRRLLVNADGQLLWRTVRGRCLVGGSSGSQEISWGRWAASPDKSRGNEWAVRGAIRPAEAARLARGPRKQW